jgi:hypothetical protein
VHVVVWTPAQSLFPVYLLTLARHICSFISSTTHEFPPPLSDIFLRRCSRNQFHDRLSLHERTAPISHSPPHGSQIVCMYHLLCPAEAGLCLFAETRTPVQRAPFPRSYTATRLCPLSPSIPASLTQKNTSASRGMPWNVSQDGPVDVVVTRSPFSHEPAVRVSVSVSHR